MTTPKAQFEDRDLMRYYDGELDDEQAAALEEWLDGDASDDEASAVARDKLAGLDMVGGLLREMAHDDHGVDDIVDAVMAGLDASDEEADAPEPALRHIEGGKLEADEADATPANDNSSWIFTFAGVAAAAAAALFFWGKQEVPEPTAALSPAPSVTEAAPAPSAPSPAPETLAAEEPADEGVKIAAVDFGAHQGSVFYVSGGKTTSAVVWITDPGGE